MLDYFTSRENFLDVGEQYIGHLSETINEWVKFTRFYSDINNDRRAKDDEYKRDQFIGEELDWKMLADNLSLFSSQAENVKELQGFDPGANLLVDQSIMQDGDVTSQYPNREAPMDAFSDSGDNDGRSYVKTSIASIDFGEIRPKDEILANPAQNVRSSMRMDRPSEDMT